MSPTCNVVVVLAETITQFDVVFRRRSVTDYITIPLRRRSLSVRSLTTCVWLRTDDLVNYGTIWSYAVDSSWLTADAATNAFTAYDYASLKVTKRTFVEGKVCQVRCFFRAAGGLPLTL